MAGRAVEGLQPGAARLSEGDEETEVAPRAPGYGFTNPG